MNFMLTEMGTNSSLDGQPRLVIKRSFAQKTSRGSRGGISMNMLICNGCRYPDTDLSKEHRLFFLRCEKCGPGGSIAPIKVGFMACVGRRKARTRR